MFQLVSAFSPTGDQPTAIQKLADGLDKKIMRQTLLGVTGSGKTFTMANVIAHAQRPTLVISPNKTLAAQLYQEFKDFFPNNAVHYFVSYYDYYQPEAYLPQTDTYIEKDAKINELIDALRHASTASLLMRRDVIIVASVSCIYGIGDPEEYQKVSLEIKTGSRLTASELTKNLTTLQYIRNPIDPRQGNFRMRENTVEIHLPSGEEIISIAFQKNNVVGITQRGREFSGPAHSLSSIRIFPAKHFVTPHDTLSVAMANIKQELKDRLLELKKQEKVLEYARLKQRTEFDLEMLQKTGYVNGIENYSRQLDFRKPGTPPFTLLDYFKHSKSDFLTIIDESHVAVPQIGGMYNGDRARKQVLVDYGFRLPSAMDNRPLTSTEFNAKVGQVIYMSATPGPYELQESKTHIAEQLIRPTGILDPNIEVRPTKNQIKDVTKEIKKRIAKNERSLVMALTKRLAEDISEYLKEAGIKAEYLHSEIKTLDRPNVLKKLRTGEHDVIVGINLLREGLDIPEVSLITVLDADKEGFLRNKTTLLQIMGRAARHPDGQVILYGDKITDSMKYAIEETERRRKIQSAYNAKHGIIPTHMKKEIRDIEFGGISESTDTLLIPITPYSKEIMTSLKKEMKKAAGELDFERAAKLRDTMERMKIDLHKKK